MFYLLNHYNLFIQVQSQFPKSNCRITSNASTNKMFAYCLEVELYTDSYLSLGASHHGPYVNHDWYFMMKHKLRRVHCRKEREEGAGGKREPSAFPCTMVWV